MIRPVSGFIPLVRRGLGGLNHGMIRTVLAWLALPALLVSLRADGPGDNAAEKVRPVPPPGVAIAPADPSAVYVLWITSLVDDGAGAFWAGVGEVELRGVPNST